MKKEEVELIARQASDDTLNRLFERLGIDVDDFTEMQKDFHYLRHQRLTSEQIGLWSKRIILTSFISGVISMLVVALKEVFSL